jgi:hypothetical protein
VNGLIRAGRPTKPKLICRAPETIHPFASSSNTTRAAIELCRSCAAFIHSAGTVQTTAGASAANRCKWHTIPDAQPADPINSPKGWAGTEYGRPSAASRRRLRDVGAFGCHSLSKARGLSSRHLDHRSGRRDSWHRSQADTERG